MRDFIYDLRRTLTGKFTITVIAIIIIISALLGYAFTSGGGSTNGAPSLRTQSSYTYDNGTYNVTIFAYNQYGQAAPTLPIYAQYNGSNFNLTTNSNGFAEYTIHSNDSLVQFNYSLSPLGSGTAFVNHMPMSGQYNPYYKEQVSLTSIIKPGTRNSHELLVYYSPTYLNQTSNTIYLYYTFYNLTGSSSINLQINNMTYYSQISVNKVGVQIFDINPANRSATQGIYVAAFNGNNSTAQYISTAGYVPQTIVSTLGVASLAFQIFATIFGIFIPLLASLSAYFYFGKDKASGVLESIIIRPVTKGRIILSRYIANVSSMIVAFALGTAVFDIFLYTGTGTHLTLYYAGSLIWSYFVEIAAFTGLIYLVSQYMKSQGAILGAVIGLFVVFALFWTGIIEPLVLTYLFHAVSGTNQYQQYQIYMDMINPASYGSLIVLYISPVNLLGNTIDAAKFGVTELSLAVVGLFWVLVPIVAGFIIGRKRD